MSIQNNALPTIPMIAMPLEPECTVFSAGVGVIVFDGAFPWTENVGYHIIATVRVREVFNMVKNQERTK